MTKTVLLTRPQRQSVETAGKLWERGWKSRIAPLFIIEPIPAVIDTARYQAILLTSANAAPALKDLPPLPIFAVGDATAQTARNMTNAPVESAAGDAAALIELIKKSIDPAKGPLLYLSGLDRSVDLEAPGFTIDLKEVYAARPIEHLSAETIAALKDGQIFATLLYSPAAARQFRSVMERAGADLGGLTLICLSSKVAEAAGEGWKRVETAQSPNEDALFHALEQCYAAPIMTETKKPCVSSGSPKVAQVAFNLSIIALCLAGTVPLWSPYVQDYFGVVSPTRQKVESLNRAFIDLTTEVENAKGTTTSPASSNTGIEALSEQVRTLDERLKTVTEELTKSQASNAELSAALEKITQSQSAEKTADVANTRLNATLQLNAALQTGEPFATQLAALRALNDSELTAKLDAAALEAYQDKGLPTRAKLLADYAPAVRATLAQTKIQSQGILGNLSGLVSVRKQGDVEGDDAQSVFARAEVKLNSGDLTGALTELEKLPEPEAAAFKNWSDQAKARLAAEHLAAELVNVKAPSN